MSSTFLRRGAVLVAVAALALAGCSDDASTSPTTGATGSSATPTDGATPAVPATYDTPATTCTDVAAEDGPLAGVAVGGDLGTVPTITVDGDLTIGEENVVRVMCNGDGATVNAGDMVVYLARAAQADGTEMYVSEAPSSFTVDDTEVAKGGVAGLTVGTRLVIGFPNDGTPVAQVVEIVDAIAADDIVTDEKVGAAGLPTVDAPADTKPTVTLPADGLATPRNVVRVVLEEGDGALVTSTDTIKAHYLGVKGSDGTEFDSSWSRGTDPSEFSLSSVVAGWTHGLSDVKVGSTVMLVIPPLFGYGSSPTNELAQETMVFVVTITEATPAS